MQKRLFLILLVCGLGLMRPLPVCAQTSKVPPPVKETQASPEFTTYTIPAGSALHVLLQTPVTTASNQINDPIEVELAQNVYLGDRLLMTRDDHLRGKITLLLAPIEGRNGVVEVRFTDLLLHNGEDLPISAYVNTGRADHRWGGEVTEGTKAETVVHSIWGIGQYKQLVWRGPRRMGEQVELKPGEYWMVVLDQPVTIVTPKGDAESSP